MTFPLSSAPTDPGPPPVEPPAPASAAPQPPQAARPPRGDRFFSWTAGLGFVRGDGWIGGVATALAARMRIDPLIVRGILVVIGLFGFPVLFLYAIAWALLPDLDGRIPLQEALRGRVSPALVGIAAFALLGLVPTPLAFLLGAPGLFVWYDDRSAFFTLAILAVGLLIVAGLVLLIVRAALRSPRTPDPVATLADQRTASAASEAPESSDAASGSGPVASADAAGVDVAGFAASTPALTLSAPASEPDEHTEPVEPIEPAEPDADAEAAATADAEYAAWREQHAAWKAQDDAWRRHQQDAARAARDQARRERQAQGAAFTAEAAERRRVRRLTKPRTPFAYVAVVIGLAIVAGALAALTGRGELAPALGLFVAALILALGMLAAGVLRRRSGFLTFMTVLVLVGGAGATAVPTVMSLHVGSYWISNQPGELQYPVDDPFVQPWGDLSVTIFDTQKPTTPIHIDKRSGTTWVNVHRGVALSLDVTAPANALVLFSDEGERIELTTLRDLSIRALPGGQTHVTGIIMPGAEEATTEQTLVIDQQSGWVQVSTYPISEELP